MRLACWITKAAKIYAEHVILLAFGRQQWQRERASMFGFYAHIFLNIL
jgi:hypothetical protein